MPDEIDEALSVAAELLRLPEKWNWKITGVLYGHGKVIVQCVTPKGKPTQFVGKVNRLHGKRV